MTQSPTDPKTPGETDSSAATPTETAAPADAKRERAAADQALQDAIRDAAREAELDLAAGASLFNEDDSIGGEAISGATGSEEAVAVLRAEMERIAAERDQYKDQVLRTAAETENVRKRMDREVQKARDFAIEKFAMALLPVADNLELALANTPEAEEDGLVRQFVTGVEMTQRELMKAFEGNKVVRLQAQGARLDPNLHHAIQQEHDASVPHETVSAVLQPGYTIAERLLRPALVKVATGGPRVAAEPATESSTADTISDADAADAIEDAAAAQDAQSSATGTDG